MTKDQIMGGLLGVVVGDALGLPVQFQTRSELRQDPVNGMRGWGAFNMPPGSISDDGSLTLCLAESICEAGINPDDAAQRFLRWFNEGYWTPGGKAYDIGMSTYRAMDNLNAGIPATQAGSGEEHDNGNGSLMRIMPAAIYLAEADIDTLVAGIWNISRITHGHPRACSACYLYALLVRELLHGCTPQEAYRNLCGLPSVVLKAGIADSERIHFDRILSGILPDIKESKISSSGYVIHTLEASIWCLLNSPDYDATVLKAVNLGDDTDTTAAVVGGLAGIAYGVEGIPAEWLEVLVLRDGILALANRFAERVLGE